MYLEGFFVFLFDLEVCFIILLYVFVFFFVYLKELLKEVFFIKS